MKRREFIAGLGGAAVWPHAARAQQGDRMRRIAVLMPGNQNDPLAKARISAFAQALAGMGWTEGRNMRMDLRWFDDNTLYFRREDWACRRCCDLGYQSELEAKGRRGLMRARKIQARLGGDRSGFEFPDKPRGMHWRTYERWREKHETAVAKSWSGLWGSRFARRLGLG